MTFGLLWLILVMAFPRGYTNIKTYGLIVISFIAFLEMMIFYIKINTKYVIVIIGFICMCLSSLLLGLINGYKFDTHDFVLIQYYVMIPICALILSMIFYSNDRLCNLKKVLIFINFYINSFNLLYFLADRNILPKFAFFNMGFLASAQTQQNQLALRMSNEPALIFLMPFIIITLYDLKGYKKIYKLMSYFGTFLGIIYAALSGRRALQVVIIFSLCYLVILLLKEKNLGKISKFAIIFLGAIIGISIILTFMSDILELDSIFKSITETFSKGFDKKDYGMVKRSSNMIALLDGWANNPFTVLFGNGLNSYSKYSIASSTTMWSYEVFYPAFLYQTGIVGTSLFFIIIIGIIIKLNKKSKTMEYSNDYRAIKIAFICVIVATGTNPLIFNVWLWGVVGAFII